MVATPENTHVSLARESKVPQRIKRPARSWLQNRYSGKVRLPRALITKRLTCGFRDEDTLGYGYYALNDCRIIPMSDAPIE